MRYLSLVPIAPLLASCAMAVEPPARSERAEAQLQSMIAGKVAGQPVSCLPSHQSGGMVAIDDHTIVFGSGSKRVYVNNTRGGCSNLKSGHYALVTRSIGGMGPCSGDIAQVADVSTGVVVGSCALGDFVPYTSTS
ncbi:MAG TPA: hypothetical protein VNH53_11230 [Sphingomicrobium sp.]|jgi:hypothetical protein|nr:hypothetical protein [Sphingomicrobium sp.]